MKEIMVNIERCLSCHSCELACAVAHSSGKTLFSAVSETPKPLKRIFVHSSGTKNVPVSCRHCEEAPCIDACIAGAMHRTADGTVTNEGGSGVCTGCWMCVMVCPYGVIRSRQTARVAVKCDRNCLNREGVPACVQACPTGALQFIEVDEFSIQKRKNFVAVF
ncbi:4Fe-4S ferredoxin iron-sulfur binding domain protein [Desulfofarcimen acetoxidans DSM 771]|jgi:carbon-monoxide dehydrogenase iron sulfur subunit|uniref:4Fe-4S ferredoxin iron-sulfur binding domain protein n=1 Tax=Desulfofarcimen acetoxidans (strain ATCC 49208 / DSM 771 / KCTC 5769 / VKM B-1644 / 5575) TaxID=485916 RepID=C8W086_DESAS|nr:4Fe-4S dicluster domain-containing protein [Desulfofarcimen acetoxidans]ACV63141.1 4Fe-4S ferredoxin iron-sulfur binding domain protein [Desulfofarcimen acetoxidans DSM 771]